MIGFGRSGVWLDFSLKEMDEAERLGRRWNAKEKVWYFVGTANDAFWVCGQWTPRLYLDMYALCCTKSIHSNRRFPLRCIEQHRLKDFEKKGMIWRRRKSPSEWIGLAQHRLWNPLRWNLGVHRPNSQTASFSVDTKHHTFSFTLHVPPSLLASSFCLNGTYSRKW